MNKFTIALASAASIAIAACNEAPEDEDLASETDAAAEAEVAVGNILDIAMTNEDFSTLVSAASAADLSETLQGDGPFTVFAPDNDAFAKIPEETLNELTTNDTDTLGTILSYHVVSGEVDAATLTQAIADAGNGGYSIETLGGGTLTAELVNGQVVLSDATGGTSTVTATDVVASNGVIHAIDTVLMPQ